MTLLDRYVFLEWLKIFLLSLLCIVGLLLLEDIFDDGKELLSMGATAGTFFTYYLVQLPSLLPTTLPMALLLSVLFSLSKLNRNLELTAMRSAGMGLMRITRSLWGGSVLLAIALFMLQAQAVPWSVETARLLWQNQQFASEIETKGDASEVGLVPNLTFYNHNAARRWYMNEFNDFNYRAFGVSVYQLDERGRVLSQIDANEAYYDHDAGYWTFQHGRETFFDRETMGPRRSLAFETREVPEFTEPPHIMRHLRSRLKDLSLWEIQTVLGALSEGNDPRINSYWIRYHAMLAAPFSILVVTALAIPFAVTGVRTNPWINATKCLLLFLLYYMVSRVIQVVGSRELIAPMVAAWVPNIVALVLAGYLAIKAGRPGNQG